MFDVQATSQTPKIWCNIYSFFKFCEDQLPKYHRTTRVPLMGGCAQIQSQLTMVKCKKNHTCCTYLDSWITHFTVAWLSYQWYLNHSKIFYVITNSIHYGQTNNINWQWKYRKIQENLKIKVGAKISRCPERGLNMGRIACEYSIRTWELVTELVISITFYRCLW